MCVWCLTLRDIWSVDIKLRGRAVIENTVWMSTWTHTHTHTQLGYYRGQCLFLNYMYLSFCLPCNCTTHLPSNWLTVQEHMLEWYCVSALCRLPIPYIIQLVIDFTHTHTHTVQLYICDLVTTQLLVFCYPLQYSLSTQSSCCIAAAI